MHDAPPCELTLSTDAGDILISEEHLPTFTDEELVKFRLTRRQLNRLFAEGVQLMQGKTISDRVRPRASQALDGKWVVELMRYSPLNDPLMRQRRPKGLRSKN